MKTAKDLSRLMVDICLSERGAISIFHSPQVVLLVRQDRQDYDTLSNPNGWMTVHLNKLTFGRKLWSQQNILSITLASSTTHCRRSGITVPPPSFFEADYHNDLARRARMKHRLTPQQTLWLIDIKGVFCVWAEGSKNPFWTRHDENKNFWERMFCRFFKIRWFHGLMLDFRICYAK